MNPRPTSRLLGFVRDTSREDTGPFLAAARGAHPILPPRRGVNPSRDYPRSPVAAILSRASPRPLDRLAARATVAAAAFLPMSNKNIFGLGPGVTGGVLGAVFFGVYLASSQLTKKFVMQQSGTPPEKPAYFRDVNVINEPRSK